MKDSVTFDLCLRLAQIIRTWLSGVNKVKVKWWWWRGWSMLEDVIGHRPKKLIHNSETQQIGGTQKPQNFLQNLRIKWNWGELISNPHTYFSYLFKGPYRMFEGFWPTTLIQWTHISGLKLFIVHKIVFLSNFFIFDQRGPIFTLAVVALFPKQVLLRQSTQKPKAQKQHQKTCELGSQNFFLC